MCEVNISDVGRSILALEENADALTAEIVDLSHQITRLQAIKDKKMAERKACYDTVSLLVNIRNQY